MYYAQVENLFVNSSINNFFILIALSIVTDAIVTLPRQRLSMSWRHKHMAHNGEKYLNQGRTRIGNQFSSSLLEISFSK